MTQTENPLASPEPWDLVADGYAAEAHLVMEPFSRRAIELAAPAPAARVVDVAAGPGTTTLLLAPRVARVDAIDFSPTMVDQLRRRAAERGLRNVEARVGDGQALPYPEKAFDAAFSMFGLMFFPDRARGFAELRRVLRPGGVAVVSSWAPPEQSPLMTTMFGALAAANPGQPPSPRVLLPLGDPASFEAEARSAGFTDVTVHPHTLHVEFRSPAEFWASMTRSNAPMVLLRKRLGEEAWRAASDRAVAYLEGHLAGGPSALATTALLARCA